MTSPPPPSRRARISSEARPAVARRSVPPSLHERGGARAPGPLRHFVHDRRLFALQLYLLLHCLARSKPWDASHPAATWARALDRTNPGAEGTVSRSWSWLEDRRLVRTERDKRMVRAYLLQEDGSGAEYARSRDFFYFPLAFFREGWHTRLGLAGTCVLLIGLQRSRRQPWFELRTEAQSKWYGVSPDTLQRGLDELRDADLLRIHPRQVRDNKARFGTTTINVYLLLGAFATPNTSPSTVAEVS